MADTDPYFSVPEKRSKGVSDEKTGMPGAAKPQQDATTSSGPVGAGMNKKAVASSGATTGATISSTPSRQTQGPASASKGAESKAFSLEEANEEIALLLQSGKVTQKEVSALQGLMRDHVALGEKVPKLKSLLGRSAKAQREAKMELESTSKKLEAALREIDRLSSKVERLANRPTHMDLLADFETNFDKALLSVGNTQSGGQDTAASPAAPNAAASAVQHGIQPVQNEAVVDSMLLQELAESQNRVEKLESLNTALLHRSSQMESQVKELQREKDTAQQHLARVQLELRMAKMEADNATRSVHDKIQSLQEMQLEIDLVTKASMDANVRAKQGEEAARSVQSDRERVQQLQAQVQALQEWALASAEAKRLSQERVRFLETKVKALESSDTEVAKPGNNSERILTTKTSSLVVGAGHIGSVVVGLGEHAHSLRDGERVVLRWRFDVTPSDLSLEFSILKGKCETPQKRLRADYLVKDR